MSACQAITITSIAGLEGKSIQIYPNPSSQYFSIDLQNVNSNASIHISSIDGRLLNQIESNGNEIIQIEQNFEKGVYLVSVYLKGYVQNLKLVVD